MFSRTRIRHARVTRCRVLQPFTWTLTLFSDNGCNADGAVRFLRAGPQTYSQKTNLKEMGRNNLEVCVVTTAHITFSPFLARTTQSRSTQSRA